MKSDANPYDFITNDAFTLEDLRTNPPPTAKGQNIFIGGVESLEESELEKGSINAVLTIMTQKEMRKCKVESKVEELDSINKHMSLIIHQEHDPIAPYFIPAIDFIR